MAPKMNKNRKKNDAKSPQQQENKRGKMNDIVYGLLAFLVATVIMLAVFGGAFYVIVHNNINGIGEKLRPRIMNIPVLNLALPEAPDPNDEKYMSEKEVRQRYREQQDTISMLRKQLDQEKKSRAELQKFKDEYDTLAAELEEGNKALEAERKQLEADREQLAKDKQQFDQMVAEGDKEGFKVFFENIDGETAAKIYTEIMQEEKADAEAIKFAKMYEAMEPDSVADILQEMGTSKMDLILGILKSMKREFTAQVLSEMETGFASKITEKLAQQHFGNE